MRRNRRLKAGAVGSVEAIVAAAATTSAAEADVASRGGDLRRHLRLQLSRVEGKLLSGRSCGRENASLLRRAFPHRRDQLYLLSDAIGEDSCRMGTAEPA